MQAWLLTFALGYAGGYGLGCPTSGRLRAALLLIMAAAPALPLGYLTETGACPGQRECMNGFAVVLLLILSPAWWLCLGLGYWMRRRKFRAGLVREPVETPE